jgi:hypothetical protein
MRKLVLVSVIFGSLLAAGFAPIWQETDFAAPARISVNRRQRELPSRAAPIPARARVSA